MELGKRIKQLRLKAALTQEDLGERLGLGAQAISKWENGVTMPDVAQLPSIAEVFGVTIDDLFDLSVEQRFRRIENRLDVEDNLPQDVFLEYETFLKEQVKDPKYQKQALSLISYLYWHRSEMYGKKAASYAKESIHLNPGEKDCQWILQKTERHVAWDWNMSNHTSAIEFYLELVKQSPNESLPYRLLIDNLIADHRVDEAESYLAKLETLERVNPILEAFYHAYIALARYKEKEADEIVASLLKDHPEESACLFEAAQYYAKKADYKSAIGLYEKSFENEKRRPRFTDELMAIADIYEIMGDYGNAAATYGRMQTLLREEWGYTESDQLNSLEKKKQELLEKSR